MICFENLLQANTTRKIIAGVVNKHDHTGLTLWHYKVQTKPTEKNWCLWPPALKGNKISFLGFWGEIWLGHLFMRFNCQLSLVDTYLLK